MASKYILILTAIMLLVALSCKKTPEIPTGNNKIEIGQTAADSVGYFAANVSTIINSTGGIQVTQHGHCWSTKSKPTTEDDKTSLGKLEGPKTYNSELSDLAANTNYYLRPYVTYANGTVYGEERNIKTLKTRKPVVSTTTVTNITRSSAQCRGTNDDGGFSVSERGVCWNTTGNPTLQNNTGYTTDGSGTGSFISQLTGLAENTPYYVAAYATNEKGTEYGEAISFTTLELTLPTVETANITNITYNSATGGGNVTFDGNGTVGARGVCWNTTGNPSLQNNTGYTTNGSGTGTYTSQLTGLTENTTYYVAAYATNEKGTGYGEAISFTTLELTLPVVETATITNITYNSATGGGNVTSDGNGNIMVRGVCWNTTGNPTLQNNTDHTTDGNGTGTFTSQLTGLTENTTYYVAAYATNEEGTAYGQVVSFVTEPLFVEFVSVTGGTFQMGSNDGESDEQPVHTVTLSSFEISKYEITNSQYCEFLNDIGCNSNGSYNGTEYIDMDNGDCQIYYSGGQFVPKSGKTYFPVIEVSWYGAYALALWAGGRLPTEAEWEFAARGGNSSNSYTYSGSNTVGDVAWYYENSGGHTHQIGTKTTNELGIHDMSGNVWEWCNDWYDSDYYSSSPQNNPQGPSSGTYRVLRGGSWNSNALNCRVPNRYRFLPVNSNYYYGFRIAR